MSLNVFLKVVEIQTKLASLFPFIIGVLFSMTYFGEVQWGNTLVFFIGMVVFDGTALSAILTLFNRLDLEQMIFIVCITPFLNNLWFL